jgi:ribonuclease P/MRP protein subunit POP1
VKSDGTQIQFPYQEDIKLLKLANTVIAMPPKPNISNKKAKLYNSRSIRAELTDPSFNEGKLSVPDFLSSRNFEIKSFELSQLNSKYASSTRCFQSLPRKLRRRTASHNVKRIPKRLRNRALREMQNSINGLPPKKKHLRGRELYRLKMSKRLLKLASRIKSLRSVPSEDIQNKPLKLRQKLKILDEQIKLLCKNTAKPTLNNKMGSYDNTGINAFASKPRGNLKYAKRQNNFVWIPTHVWHAKRFHMIKKWGYQIPLEPTQKCFKSTNRASRNETIIYDTSYYDCLIVETVNSAEANTFLNIITKLKGDIPKKILSGHKCYDDWLFKDGKRIGMGLVFSVEDLNKILIRVHPSLYDEFFEYVKSLLKVSETGNNVFDCRYSLGSIELNGPKSVNSLSKVLHLNSSDPITKNWFELAKLNDPNSVPNGTTFSFNIKDPRFFKSPTNVPYNTDVVNFNDLIVRLSQERTIDIDTLDVLLDNGKRNNTYCDQLSTKEISREFQKDKVVQKMHEFPVLITKLKSSNNWTLICPWYWTLPIWLKLNQIHHISTGGIKQLHQINFEHCRALYPIDFQFLKEGYLENKFKSTIAEAQYAKKPKSKRPKYEISEGIISPFGCDWDFLQKMIFASSLSNNSTLCTKNQFGNFDENLIRKVESVNDVIALVKQCQSNDQIPIELYDKHNPQHIKFINKSLFEHMDEFPKVPVLQINLQIQGRGSIQDNSRIYRIPSETRNQYLRGTFDHCPPPTDLIGFVTSGSYNLNLGFASGIGCIVASHKDELVLVRNVGSSLTRLAKWSII